MVTDGHSSRLDINVLRFCHDKQINQFVLPPDTTGVTQPLDQVNSSLHRCYSKKAVLENHINCEAFMIILSQIWNSWTSPHSLVKAAKRCGISEGELSLSWMQKEMFVTADIIIESPQHTAAKRKPVWESESPPNVRSYSRDYY